MKPQSYKNHIFYYPPHHYFFYGAVIAAFAVCGFGIYKYEEQRLLWIFMAAVIFLITWLAVMVRMHYALGNQNRIVRLEMRLRYYILTGKRFEQIEERLDFKQIAALRFAPDEELPALLDKAIKEHLSPDEIKRNIINWLPDKMRV
jgi:hypothetical protein